MQHYVENSYNDAAKLGGRTKDVGAIPTLGKAVLFATRCIMQQKKSCEVSSKRTFAHGNGFG
jgi:hypothetical protein